MLLPYYMSKYKIERKEFGKRVGISRRTLENYLYGFRKPIQAIAERIERETDGLVTVLELRGKDDRGKIERVFHSGGGCYLCARHSEYHLRPDPGGEDSGNERGKAIGDS